jgi:hypothetical protein
MNDSEIRYSPHSTTFAGSDAVELVRAVSLKHALLLYAKTGMRITQAASPTVMLEMAKRYTGRTFKGVNKYRDAAEAVSVWVETMKAALPATVVHGDGSEEQV